MKELEEIKQSIKDVCAFPSVQEAPLEGKPFGEAVYDALEYMLGLGKKFGFETKNYDGYAGEIIWNADKSLQKEDKRTLDGSENYDTLGILCHLDVVKAGRLSDWKYPPFTPTEEDGKIYARGTLDDKGPAVISLYVLKMLKDEGFRPQKTVKLILGCNEESGWEGMKHYAKVAKMPDFGFSPDANFPVIYAEKGIYCAKFEFPCSKEIKECRGGDTSNMVCDYAYAVAPVNEKLAKKYGLKSEGDKAESFGVSAHGSTPEKGKNAIDPLLKYLTACNLVDESVHKMLFEDVFGLKKVHDETGYLTMSPDIIEAKDGKMHITVDFRYPATLKPDFIKEAADKIGPHEVRGDQAPLYNDKNGFLIQTLLKVYNEEMNTDLKPIAIGGGTYARALPVGAAFGPEFPGEKAPIHEPNEYITAESIERMCRIYKQAVKRLTE